MKIRLGSVLWKDDPRGGHHYVVITPAHLPEVLVVSITSQGARKDQSCVLPVGIHPCVVQESVVGFDYAEVVLTDEVQRNVDIGLFALKDDASPAMMQLIWEGAFKTNRMTLRCRKLLEETIPY